jgi:hypothetical protein
MKLDKAFIEKAHKDMQAAHKAWEETQARLAEDTSGPKPGDMYFAKPGSYPIPHDDECDVDLDVWWVVVLNHPDDETLAYVIPYDDIGYPRGDSYDVELGAGIVLRVGAGTWIEKSRFASVCQRVSYLAPETVRQAREALSRLATGGPPIRTEMNTAAEARAMECVKMAYGLAETCEP